MTDTPDLRNRLYAASWTDGTGRRVVDLDLAVEIALDTVISELRQLLDQDVPTR